MTLAIVQVVLFIIQIFGIFNVHHLVSSLVEKSRTEAQSSGTLPATTVNVDFSSLELQMKEFERRVMDTVLTVHKFPVTRSAGPVLAIPDIRESIGSIMARTGTDKISRHAYDRYYELHFKDFREKKDLQILEIGAQSGRSIQLW